MKQKKKTLFIIGDGDEIRHHIEFYLLSGNLESLSHYSKHIKEGIEAIEAYAVSHMHADIIYVGGDDLLFRLDEMDYQLADLQTTSETFFEMTGSTISFGVGETVEEAFLNLRRAKAIGKGKIVQPKV